MAVKRGRKRQKSKRTVKQQQKDGQKTAVKDATKATQQSTTGRRAVQQAEIGLKSPAGLKGVHFSLTFLS